MNEVINEIMSPYERVKQWRKDNKDAYNQQRARWRTKNKDRYNEYFKLYMRDYRAKKKLEQQQLMQQQQ
jgi:hypothetical protein